MKSEDENLADVLDWLHAKHLLHDRKQQDLLADMTGEAYRLILNHTEIENATHMSPVVSQDYRQVYRKLDNVLENLYGVDDDPCMLHDLIQVKEMLTEYRSTEYLRENQGYIQSLFTDVS